MNNDCLQGQLQILAREDAHRRHAVLCLLLACTQFTECRRCSDRDMEWL
jgi:hypothetical protein